MRTLSAKVSEVGHRSGNQFSVQLGRPLATATHRRAHSHHVGVDAAQLAPPQLARHRERSARRADGSDQRRELAL